MHSQTLLGRLVISYKKSLAGTSASAPLSHAFIQSKPVMVKHNGADMHMSPPFMNNILQCGEPNNC